MKFCNIKKYNIILSNNTITVNKLLYNCIKLKYNKYSITSKFSNFFSKEGLKKTFFKNFEKFVLNLFNLLRFKNLEISNNLDIEEFSYILKKNKSLNNINSLINYIFKKSQVGFKISCNKIDKKYKKKLKKKYLFKLNYLNKNKRLNYFLNTISFLIKKNDSRFFSNKLIKFFNTSLFKFLDSDIHKFKILTLKYLTKKN